MKGKFFLVTLISSVIWASVAAQVKTGIDVLQESGFSILAGKKVGLLTTRPVLTAICGRLSIFSMPLKRLT